MRIAVVDTGIGIAKESQGNLFQNFAQADETTTRRFGGTGLGLAISKHLVILMGGEIALESELNQGTTVWFTIPLLEAKRPIASDTPSRSDGSEQDVKLEGVRLLVVEDNAINQKFVKAIMQQLGCRADYCENGLKAVEAVRTRSYDLILMDCHMPEMDGFAATIEIRRFEKEQGSLGRIPIVALTASAMKEDHERCMGSGMDHVLTKPIKPKLLKDALSEFVRSRA